MKKTLGLLIFILFAALSCGNKSVFNENIVIPEARWDNTQLPYFDVNIDDTVGVHSFYINVRHLENYRYSNLYVFLHTTFPNGNQTHDTIECMLAHPDGSWVGRGTGSMRSSEILLNESLRFPVKGTYHFEIEQAMREPVLKGITDIGLHIEKER